MKAPRGSSVTDLVRDAVRTLKGEFGPSAVHALLPELERATIRSILVNLATQKELRLVAPGEPKRGPHREAVYEALPALVRSPTNLEALRRGAAFLQGLYLAWGGARPTDNIGVLRAAAD